MSAAHWLALLNAMSGLGCLVIAAVVALIWTTIESKDRNIPERKRTPTRATFAVVFIAATGVHHLVRAADVLFGFAAETLLVTASLMTAATVATAIYKAWVAGPILDHIRMRFCNWVRP